MITLIHCNECNKTGMFDIQFKFVLESHSCEKCSHHKFDEWSYYFCNIPCLMSWLEKNEIEEKGFPCKDCRDRDGISTGWRWGFESNGVCDTCNGEKRVKGHRKQEWEYRKEKLEN